MIVRSAYFEGDVALENRERFAQLVREKIAPCMRGFPDIRRLAFYWGKEYESDERCFYLTIEHGYDSFEAVVAATSSAQRRDMDNAIAELMSLFDGRVYHVNHEVDQLL